MKPFSLVVFVLLLGLPDCSCEPPEGTPPDKVLGTWVGTCDSTSGVFEGALEVEVVIAKDAAPEVALGGAHLTDGKYLACEGFAMSSCDIVIDGSLEGQMDPSLSDSYTAYSSFHWMEGEAQHIEVTVMEPGAIFSTEFSCVGDDLRQP